MQSEKVKSEFVIHWGDIFRHILKRWWIILIALVVGVAGGGLYGHLTYHPVYETQVVYIVSYSGAGESMGEISSEYSLVQRILNNCIMIGKQNRFMESLERDFKAAEPSYPEKITAQYLQGVVFYMNNAENSSENGTTLTISIQTSSARRSFDIANVLAVSYPEYVKETYIFAKDQSLEFSLINEPTEAVAPMEGSKVIMFGALMGVAFAVLAFAIIFFVTLFDNRIKTEADIEDKYDIPVLGIIPRWEDIISIKGEKKHARKK